MSFSVVYYCSAGFILSGNHSIVVYLELFLSSFDTARIFKRMTCNMCDEYCHGCTFVESEFCKSHVNDVKAMFANDIGRGYHRAVIRGAARYSEGSLFRTRKFTIPGGSLIRK